MFVLIKFSELLSPLTLLSSHSFMSQDTHNLSSGGDGHPPPSRQPQHDDPFVFYQPPPPGRENVPRPASDQWLRHPAWIGKFFLRFLCLFFFHD